MFSTRRRREIFSDEVMRADVVSCVLPTHTGPMFNAALAYLGIGWNATAAVALLEPVGGWCGSAWKETAGDPLEQGRIVAGKAERLLVHCG